MGRHILNNKLDDGPTGTKHRSGNLTSGTKMFNRLLVLYQTSSL